VPFEVTVPVVVSPGSGRPAAAAGAAASRRTAAAIPQTLVTAGSYPRKRDESAVGEPAATATCELGARSYREVRVMADETPTTTPAQGDGAAAKATGAAVSVGMFILPAITIIGLFEVTGALGRVQRAYPELLTAAFVALLIAGWLMVIRPAEDPPKDESLGWLTKLWAWLRRRGPSAGLAALFTVVGTGLAIYLAIQTATISPRPQITASTTEDGKEFTATVTAEYMAPNRRIAIQVDALTDRREIEASQAGEVAEGERVYSAYVGPKSDGNVSHTLTIPNPAPKARAVSVRAFTGDGATPCVLGTRPSTANVTDEEYGSGTACVTTVVSPPAPTSPPAPASTPAAGPEEG
jgi:hypothetical protein